MKLLANNTSGMGKNAGRFFDFFFFFYFGYFEGKLNWKTEMKMESSQEGFCNITHNNWTLQI